ncbi:MAG: YggS family pyridoxal phosphate-dependent enzyme [Proteobacteria bacterium]|nr:YggS family pyridoxal phosphate-dependent enzyme [Pseudomonadota bacterium]
MKDILTNLHILLQRIRDAEQTYHRVPGSVSLLAVSKSHASTLIETLLGAQQHDFGENYLQEALIKISALENKQLTWHFIGPIQSKKAPLIAQHFNWVHTVSRFKEAQALSEHRPQNLGHLNICIQVKLDNNPKRGGVVPEDVPALIEVIKPLPLLRLRGLMTIPPFSEDFEQQRKYFSLVKTLYEQVNDGTMDTLSMGMTSDLEAAIAEGSTMVRIGTGLFGPR